MKSLLLLVLGFLGYNYNTTSADDSVVKVLQSGKMITAEVITQHGDEAQHGVRMLEKGKARTMQLQAIVVTVAFSLSGMHHTSKVLAAYEEGIEGSEVQVVGITWDGSNYQLLTEELARDNDLCTKVIPQLPLVPGCSCVTRPIRVRVTRP